MSQASLLAVALHLLDGGCGDVLTAGAAIGLGTAVNLLNLCAALEVGIHAESVANRNSPCVRLALALLVICVHVRKYARDLRACQEGRLTIFRGSLGECVGQTRATHISQSCP
jgi:hypothetical protein